MVPKVLGASLLVSIAVALVAAASSSSCSPMCGDCVPDYVGLVLFTGPPISSVTLSGPACAGGRFRCEPADFDSMIHDPCTRLVIDPKAEGLCVVDLDVGGQSVHLERQLIRRPPGCCGGFIGEANHQGFIDLRVTDGGADGGDAGPTGD
jgi:hypothetical protein